MMFDAGCDQADGLKRLFRPLPGARVDVIGVADDAAIRCLARGIGSALREQGVRVHWEDPTGLLAHDPESCADGHPRPRIAPATPFPAALARGGEAVASVLVSARRHDGVAASGAPAWREPAPLACTVFAAHARPAQLTALYAAIKAADALAHGSPFTVVWTCEESACEAARARYESNLASTVSRFLARGLQFDRLRPRRDDTARSAARKATRQPGPGFLDGLTASVLAQFSPADRSPIYCQN